MVSEGMDTEVRPQAHFYPVEWPEYAIHDFYEAEARMDVCIDVDTTQMALLRHDKRDRYDIFIKTTSVRLVEATPETPAFRRGEEGVPSDCDKITAC